jgi:hypothetical protein
MGKSSSDDQDDQKEPAAQTPQLGKKKQPQEISESTDSTSRPEITSTYHTSEEQSTDSPNVGDLADSSTNSTVDLTAGVQSLDGIPAGEPTKNPAAVALGRLGGLKGGKVRAQRLTKTERSEAARKAAKARWQKKEQSK